jgi:hypothetical protein
LLFKSTAFIDEGLLAKISGASDLRMGFRRSQVTGRYDRPGEGKEHRLSLISEKGPVEH